MGPTAERTAAARPLNHTLLSLPTFHKTAVFQTSSRLHREALGGTAVHYTCLQVPLEEVRLTK
ncbi:hypothetical protein ABG768_017174, partial [Culter alburnus]